MTASAWVAHDTNHTQAAPALEKALQPYADRIATNGLFPLGPVATALGCVATLQGHFDDANGYFQDASARCEKWDLRSYLALTRLHWAQMLSRRDGPGDRSRVQELADQALHSAEDIGMLRVANRPARFSRNTDRAARMSSALGVGITGHGLGRTPA